MSGKFTLITIKTEKSLCRVCRDLEAAVVNHSFGVMATHDLKQTMETKGVAFERECRIFEVCNPHQAKRVLEENPDFATALPCRIALYEEGGKVHLSTIRPTALLGFFGDGVPSEVAEEVEVSMAAIMEEAANRPSGI